MADYSYQDMLKMQEEAAVRVREMKRRAAIAVDEEPASAPIPDEVKHISYPVEIPVNTDDCSDCSEQSDASQTEALKTDADSVLVLLILVLVSSEEADPLTALALLYLLL